MESCQVAGCAAGRAHTLGTLPVVRQGCIMGLDGFLRPNLAALFFPLFRGRRR